MGRGRPHYAVVKLPPSADIGHLFMILFQNGYSEFKLVHELSEACGCGVSSGSGVPPNGGEIAEGDTDTEPRPSPSTTTQLIPHEQKWELARTGPVDRCPLSSSSGSASAVYTTPTRRPPSPAMSTPALFASESRTRESPSPKRLKQEVDDQLNDAACSSLRSLPTLMQKLNNGAGEPSGEPQEQDLRMYGQECGTESKHVGLFTSPQSLTTHNTSQSSSHDESTAALNASLASECAVELDEGTAGSARLPPSSETLANLVSALFPSTSIPVTGADVMDSAQFLANPAWSDVKGANRRSLGSVIERLHSNGASPGVETGRLKKNSEWTYKGEWKCKKCGSQVNPKHRTAQKLLRHLVSHGPRAWSCSACNSKFGLHTSFVSHNKSVHNSEATAISLRTATLEGIWFDLAKECFPEFVEQIHSCIKKTSHV